MDPEMEEEPILMPTLTDCRRLARVKAEQEKRLQMLHTRVERLTTHEQRVWKEVTSTQQMSLQAQEAQWRRQAKHGERIRIERELLTQEQVLRDRVQDMRMQVLETKDAPRHENFREKQLVGKQVREDSRRLRSALSEVKEQTFQSKCMRVEVQRQKQRQQRLRRELDRTRRQQVVQDANAIKYAELQEELQNGELAMAAAETEELSAVSRLQSSQNVRSEVVSQLQEIEARGLVGEDLSMASSGDEVPLMQMHSAQHFTNGSSVGPGGYPASSASGGLGSRAGPTQRPRSRLARNSRGHGHMVGGYAGLGQITEEHQEDDGVIDRLTEEPGYFDSERGSSYSPRTGELR